MAPIHNAARCANVAQLRRLLKSGVAPDVIESEAHRRTPLHLLCRSRSACRDGRAACFKLLREAGANLEATDALRMTPLHQAAANGNPELLSLLIQSGVNVDTRGGGHVNFLFYGTALHSAAHFLGRNRRATECVELLLKAGAAVNARSQGGTPFDIALDRGHRRAYPLFLRADAVLPECYYTDPYILRVERSGGFKKYAQNHLAAMTKLFAANGRRLPPEVVRQIMKYWLHAGYY